MFRCAKRDPLDCARGVLARLSGREATVAEFAKPFKVSAPEITKHMRILEEVGLLSTTKQEREHHCRLEQKRMQEAVAWIEHQGRF